MARRLLFLAHRIPYPPHKGEKIRAWHMLDHLAAHWDVELGCLVDDPADLAHLPVLQGRCVAVEARRVSRRRQTARALLRLRPGRPLTEGWFHEPALAAWVSAGLAARRWDAVLAYSSGMAPYVMGRRPAGGWPRRVLDMVDVDSEKWRAYAAAARPPMRQVWSREARTLLRLERRAAAAFDRTLLVSEEEARRFAELAPESGARIDWVRNGVDLARFDPALAWPRPYGPAPAIVFTGTMDYRPNVEAVRWFAAEVMPLLRALPAAPEFHIVGANPAPEVRALAERPGVHVTGAVADVRPWIAHAAASVAPLRIARGIQNKVLEAMAMARPVIASPEAFEGVRAWAGRDLLLAGEPADWARRIEEVLGGAHPGLGPAARAAVAAGHDWSAALTRLDAALEGAAAQPNPAPLRVEARP